MGLDITAYEKVTLIREMTVEQANAADYDPYPRDETLLYTDHPSRTQHDGMAEGAYAHEGKVGHLCAGSYGGYNWWRRELARLVGTTDDAVQREEVTPPAFGELIHFSDCEGFMGPKTSAKLAADFAAWRDRAAAFAADMTDGGAHWLKKYDEWATAFALASNGGAVKFH